jgi:nucleoid-associated protein YgaU
MEILPPQSKRSLGQLPLLVVLAAACVLTSGCGNQDVDTDGNGYMKAAEHAISKGNFDEAITNLQKSLRLDPNEAEAYLKLALIYEKIRADDEKAKAYYEKYIEVETDKTRRAEAEKWLSNLVNEDGATVENQPGESETLTRLVVERQKTRHEREIRELTEEHQREMAKLKEQLETAQKTEQQTEEDRQPSLDTEKTGEESKEIAALKKQVKDLREELDVIKENEDSHLKRLAETSDELQRERIQRTKLSKRLSEIEKQYETALAAIKKLEKEKAELEKLSGDQAASENDGRSEESSSTVIGITKINIPGVESIAGNTIYYKVQKGDTLNRIAEKFYGDKKRSSVIFRANNDSLTNPDDIKYGQTIKIPVLR